MSNQNIEILADTLRILDQGGYRTNGRHVELRLSKQRMEAAIVLLPDEIRDLCGREEPQPMGTEGCRYDCVKRDSFAAAVQMVKDPPDGGGSSKPVLVLNFANPVNIGGGVYKGANAQEEDLCRRSSLLRSLESSAASRYYRYNRRLHTYMGSDAVILSPEVEIFRDEHGGLMEETATVAVLTCAAPMITYGLEGLSEHEYLGMFYRRIVRMLLCAAHYGYDRLVLGAWGCGAFGNDAAVVSDLFDGALKELEANGCRFREIVFAVRSRGGESYNFREFYRNFGRRE